MKSSVTSRKQRFWALLLAFVMVVGLLPVAEVSAANYDLTTANYRDVLNTAGRMKGGEDTIYNNNAANGDSIQIDYYDADGQTFLSSTSIGPGQSQANGTHTVLKYDEAAANRQPQLTGNAVSDYWKVSSVSETAGNVVISLTALRAYTLNWDLTGGTIKLKDGSALPTSFTDGDPAISLAPDDFDATKVANTFAGWKVSTTSVGQTNDPVQAINDTTLAILDGYDGSQNAATGIDYSITFTAQWTAGNPVVTYLYNTKIKNLEYVAYQTDTLTPGTAPTRPANDPVVEGATFGGWYANPDCTKNFDFSATLNAGDAATAYAKWTNNKYDIKFNNNIPDGENASKDTPDISGVGRFRVNSSGYYNVDVTLPAAPVDANNNPYDHYTFDGWKVDVSPTPSAAPYGGNTTVSVDALLTDLGADKSPIQMIANWTGNSYYIDYNLSALGASPVPSGVAVPTQSPKKQYGTESFDIEAMDDTTNKFVFKGWSFDAKTMNPTDPTTIDLQPGTETVKNVVDSYENKWGPVVGSGNIEVYGVWNPLCAVTYYGNGDDDNSDNTGYVENGDNHILSKNTSDAVPYFVKTGYHLIGWNTQADGKGEHLNLGTSVLILADKDFYAEWKQNTYTVAFDANTTDTVTGTMTPQGFAYGDPAVALSKNQFARTGYTFTGWATTPTGAVTYTDGQEVKDLTNVDNATVTLYAVWQKNTYTITWNDGDGNVLGTTTVAYGDVPAYTLAATPTKSADATYTYTFNNTWSPAIVAVTGDTTYTAQYTAVAKTYTVTWKDYNGTVLKTDAGVTVGTIPAYTGTPTRAADTTNTYTFSGWNDGAASYAVGTALPALVADTTYTAYYSASVRNYTITWKDGDGNTLGTTTVAYGTVPTYTINKTPTKSADATYTYSFNNTWSPAIVAVTGDTTYTAQFAATAKPTGTSPAPTGTSPAPVIVTPTAVPTPAVVTPTATPTPTSTPAPVAPTEYDIEYYEELADGTEVQLKKTNNPDKYTYGVGAEIKYGIDKEGYTFEGWYSKKSNKYVKKIGTKTKGTVKLYAIFVPDDSGNGNEGDNGKGLPTDFSSLFVRLTDYTENSMTLKWEKMEYVDGYDILGSRCNSKDVIRPYEPIVSVGADVDEYVMSDLLAKTYYKFYVRAFILVNGEKRYITTSINVHGVTLNDTYGVADELDIDKVVLKYTNGKSKTKYNREKNGDVETINITMKVGQSLKIVTSEYNKDGKEIRAHRPISFESSDPNICKIGKKSSHKYGVVVADKANTYKSHTITAKAAGECDIYVFAQNGVYKKIHVTVK